MTAPSVILVPMDSLKQVVCYSDVEGSVSLTCKYINKVLSHRFWIPAFAGMTRGAIPYGCFSSSIVNLFASPQSSSRS